MYHKILKFLFTFIMILLTSPAFAAGNDNSEADPEILSLENCLEIAFQNSHEIKAIAQNVAIAEARLRQAKGSLMPALGYEITGSDSDQDQVSELSPSKQISTAGISLTQPLYNGGKLIKGIKLAKLNLEAVEVDERRTRQTLIYNVTAAYYQVWLALQKLEVAEASYDNLGRHARKVESFYQVGKASNFDLLRARVEHENLKPTVIKAQNGVILAKLNLTNIIGLEKKRAYIVDYDLSKLQLPEHMGLDPATLLRQAYQNRPELKKFEKLQEIAKLQRNMASTGFKPSVALTGFYQGTAIGENDPGAWGDNTQWRLVLSIKGNFFDGFVTPAQVEEAQANERLVAINALKLRDQIDLEVEQSLQKLKESLEVIYANQANLNLAGESLKLTQVKFESGMATTMDVRDSQLALDQTLNGYYEGISAYLTARARLELAIAVQLSCEYR